MKKRIVALTLIVVMACAAIPVCAAEPATEPEQCLRPLTTNPQTQEEMALYNALSDMNAQYDVMPAAEGGHVVNVTTPVDAQFRSRYSSWAWEVLRAVDDADDYLGQEFNINYNIVSNKLWDSSTNDIDALLDEAISEWGLRDNAALMIAFTGRSTNYGGAAYNGSRYAIIADQGRAENTIGVQHETGHCYELDHCFYPDCFMYYGATSENLNCLSDNCRNIWYVRRERY